MTAAWLVLVELEGPGDFNLDAVTFTSLFDVFYSRHGAHFSGSENRISVRLTIEDNSKVKTSAGAAKRGRQIVKEALAEVGLDKWTVMTLEAESLELVLNG